MLATKMMFQHTKQMELFWVTTGLQEIRIKTSQTRPLGSLVGSMWSCTVMEENIKSEHPMSSTFCGGTHSAIQH